MNELAARPRSPKWLAPIAVSGQLIAAGLAARLARELSLEEFEAYVLASAAFVLLVTVAPLGAEKLALSVLPPLHEAGDRRRIRGYLRFALRRGALGTLLVGSIAIAWAFWLRELNMPARAAFTIGIFVLPLGVLAHIGLEVVTATGRGRYATAVFRVVVPAVALALVLLLPASGLPLTGGWAVAAWGMGWTAACALLFGPLRDAFRRRAEHRDPQPTDTRAWRWAARPFWFFRIATGLMAQAGILALDWSGSPPAEIGAYAAGTAIAGIALVLSTSTNRAYAREISLALARRDVAAIAAMSRRRLRWLLPALALYLLAVFAFSRPLLRLFRPEFVETGLVPLRLLTVASAFSIVFALAPTFLKHLGRNRRILEATAAATALQLALLVLLLPALGATGAALSYLATSVLIYATFALLARQELLRLRTAVP